MSDDAMPAKARLNDGVGPYEPDAIRRARKPEGWPAIEDAIRSAQKYNETCFRCGETRLMWKLDHEDGEVKLWIPYSFHVCPDGYHARACDLPNAVVQADSRGLMREVAPGTEG